MSIWHGYFINVRQKQKLELDEKTRKGGHKL